ncbi:MAG: hypothetical protein ETSY1_29675 [Candidatus Entotheonella factor]|uniref:SH3b domain-containing protein n=1 Tax=Entotheonella factor TaxID=1429438 RepID=W4LE93_ENTF1|nr:MAG: hypothetical protein ETSY1_29675 [Candidatus Entotheonella factor]
MDNYGVLHGAPGQWRTAWQHSVSDDEVAVHPDPHDGVERGWHTYTQEQLRVASEVATLLVQHYRLRDVVGHEDIAPGRKKDPGPAFPMSSFRAAAVGRADDEPELYETTTALNIRTGPGSGHEKLPQSPLPKGTRLEVLSTTGVWYEVDVLDEVAGDMDISGWVHSRYARRV